MPVLRDLGQAQRLAQSADLAGGDAVHLRLSGTQATSARSETLRGSRKLRKHEPCRNLGIACPTSPTRVLNPPSRCASSPVGRALAIAGAADPFPSASISASARKVTGLLPSHREPRRSRGDGARPRFLETGPLSEPWIEASHIQGRLTATAVPEKLQ